VGLLAQHGLQLRFRSVVHKGDLAAGRAIHNYGTPIERSEDMFGTSIFARSKSGDVFHTYSTYHRRTELLMGALAWLDLAPKGRNEADGVMSWVKLHNEYAGGNQHAADCCL
jgi:predicted dithiol-disulfide oxidoreductase (DUF899 family)